MLNWSLNFFLVSENIFTSFKLSLDLKPTTTTIASTKKVTLHIYSLSTTTKEVKSATMPYKMQLTDKNDTERCLNGWSVNSIKYIPNTTTYHIEDKPYNIPQTVILI